MMDFEESWRPEPEGMDGKVLVVTAERLPLEVRPIDTDVVTDDSVVTLGAHFQDRLIARSAIPREDASMVQELLETPAQVGLLAQEDGEEGVSGSLVALLPHDEVKDVIRRQELEKEPWKASLEAPDYEAEKREGQPVLVPLGKVVRMPRKRVSPDDLKTEAADMLKNLVARGGRKVVDELLDEI